MSNELYHWGIKGMRWGVRRYQNKDGTLTPAGKKRRSKKVSAPEELSGNDENNNEEMNSGNNSEENEQTTVCENSEC